MLGMRQHQLGCSWSNSSCRAVQNSHHPRIIPSTMLNRGTTCCCASKRSGGAAAQQQGKRQPSQQQGSRSNNPDAPEMRGSMLSATITTSIRNADTLQEVEDVLDEWGSSFSAISAAAAFTRAGKLAQGRPAAATRLLTRLADKWDSVRPDATTQAVANVLWACGKLQYSKQGLWSSTLAAFMKQLQQGKSKNTCLDIANVLHGLANVAIANKGQVPGVPRSELEAAVCEMFERLQVLVTHPLLEGVEPQMIANAMWACARLKIHPSDAALNSLLQAMSRPAMLEAASAQNICNLLWAASQLREDCGWQPSVQQRVWDRILGEEQLMRLADRCKPNELSNLLLGMGRLASLPAAAPAGSASAASVISPNFARTRAVLLLQGRVAQDFSGWSSQSVANSMWACAKLYVLDEGFFGRAAAAAPSWLPTAQKTTLQQIAWACTTLQYKHQQLMAGVIDRAKQISVQQQQQQQQQRGVQLPPRDTLGVVLGVSYAVAALDMQQLAGTVREAIASSGVTHETNVGPLANMLWDVHAWLVQHQLLDGQGLAGLLTEQQLAEGKAGSEAYHAQQQQQQQQPASVLQP